MKGEQRAFMIMAEALDMIRCAESAGYALFACAVVGLGESLLEAISDTGVAAIGPHSFEKLTPEIVSAAFAKMTEKFPVEMLRSAARIPERYN